MEPNPIAFSIFGVDVRWYGVLIAAAVLIATFISMKRAPKHDLKEDTVLNILIISIPMGIIGARLYYVIFNWSYYAGNFGRIVNIRQGGLAIHGGLILGFLTAAILCYIWKVRPLNLLDLVAPCVALGQAIGRWGNYFNSEAHGGPTNLPWGIMVDGVKVHPTFLYESLWCLMLFFLLIYLDNRRRFEGQIILTYGFLYSLERIGVEALRTDSLMIGPFKQAQVISMVIMLVCAAGYIVLRRRSIKG